MIDRLKMRRFYRSQPLLFRPKPWTTGYKKIRRGFIAPIAFTGRDAFANEEKWYSKRLSEMQNAGIPYETYYKKNRPYNPSANPLQSSDLKDSEDLSAFVAVQPTQMKTTAKSPGSVPVPKTDAYGQLVNSIQQMEKTLSKQASENDKRLELYLKRLNEWAEDFTANTSRLNEQMQNFTTSNGTHAVPLEAAYNQGAADVEAVNAQQHQAVANARQQLNDKYAAKYGTNMSQNALSSEVPENVQPVSLPPADGDLRAAREILKAFQDSGAKLGEGMSMNILSQTPREIIETTRDMIPVLAASKRATEYNLAAKLNAIFAEYNLNGTVGERTRKKTQRFGYGSGFFAPWGVY